MLPRAPSLHKNKTVTGVFDMWGLRQWGAWRVMVLLQLTAAFFFFFFDESGTSALLRGARWE